MPGDNLKELSDWKDELSGRAERKSKNCHSILLLSVAVCLVVVPHLAARSQGLKVALIQDRPLFGGNASQEIRVHTLGIHGYGSDILKLIDTYHYPNGDQKAKIDQVKREKTMAESGVDLFAHHTACGIEKQGDKILSVEAREVKDGRIKRFRAPVFIDATGDGWLGYWAGADYRYGREAASQHNEGWDKYGELWSPKEADNRVMGTSVLWNSGEPIKDRISLQSHGLCQLQVSMQLPRRMVLGIFDNDLNQIDDAETIRDHMLRAIFGSFANAKKNPKYAPNRLKWVAYVGVSVNPED